MSCIFVSIVLVHKTVAEGTPLGAQALEALKRIVSTCFAVI